MTSIAKIRLNPGNVGFYDEVSRIHLTLGRPEALVPSGTNCANLRRGVKAGTISVVEGSLGRDIPPLKVVQVGSKYYLASNAAEASKPVIKEEVKPATAAKAEPVPKVEPPAENKDEKPKQEKPEQNEEEKKQDSADENTASDDNADASDKKKPVRKTRRARNKKSAE